MSWTFVRGAIAIGGVMLALTGTAAADTPPAIDLIFNHHHLDNTKQGDEIVYNFARSVSDEKLASSAFKDQIKLLIDTVDKDGKKAVTIKFYSGERARDWHETELTINPIYLQVLDQAVSMASQMMGASRPYVKNLMSVSFKDKAKVEPLKIDYKGKIVDAYKIEVMPYFQDKMSSRMKGYDESTLTVIVSNDVPGEIVEAVSTVKSRDATAPVFEDRTTLAGFGGVK
jgi:hypothetical protein